LVLLVLLPVAALSVGGYMYLQSTRYVSTENAYVKADIIQVSTDISGRVVETAVSDHQQVQAGQVLFRLDPEPHRIAMAKAEAEMGAVRNQVESLRAEYREAQGELRETNEQARFLKRQYERQKELRARGVAAMVKLDEARHALAVARERTRRIREKIQRVLANLGGDANLPPEQHPLYMEARAARDRAALDFSRTTVFAADSGIVSNVKLQIGEFVREGTPVFSLISSAEPWVEANLKETELTHVRVGQKVTVVVDAYPDLEWQATVDSISPATGAEFALLPPQNASGNWVKVVQRLPVKLRLAKKSGAPPLRAGMTVEVTIDTERESELLEIIESAVASGRDAKKNK
jgi:membrane fusion protein (multidrug efflux system)